MSAAQAIVPRIRPSQASTAPCLAYVCCRPAAANPDHPLAASNRAYLGRPRGAAPTLNGGDTAWMIVATALVLFMTLPGLSLFYGGLVRSKNVLSVLVQCLATAGVISLLWVAYGYSLAFTHGGSVQLFLGGTSKCFMRGITPESLTGTIPESLFAAYQMTFAIITPALNVGAFAEWMRFAGMLLFSVLWFTFSYLPICHMAWAGEGALFHRWGVLDFAGGTVVHVNAGIAGLVTCLLVGPRHGFPKQAMRPHNLPLAVMGTGMLWVGWFGFNAGSALAANGTAAITAGFGMGVFRCAAPILPTCARAPETRFISCSASWASCLRSPRRAPA